MPELQNPVELIAVPPPTAEQRVSRDAHPAALGERRDRYTLPAALDSASPVGYRTRVSLTPAEASEAALLFALSRPTAFVAAPSVTEQALFEEVSLGVLSSRQSTNFRGHRSVTFGPSDSERIGRLLRDAQHVEADVLSKASHTHVVLTRPYRTPFTLLLTFVGHKPLLSLFTVLHRAWTKRFQHADDLPTIGYLQHLHLGILADGMERAAVIASSGERMAQVLMGPFSSAAHRRDNRPLLDALHEMCGLTPSEQARGWRVGIVAQVGAVPRTVPVARDVMRKVGANLLSFRSERIQPGVNADDKAPAQYQSRQDMDVPDTLAFMAARAAYNAFVHWVQCGRESAKSLLLMERIDVLTQGGKERLRKVRAALNDITDHVIRDLPLWADLPLGRALSRNANRGRKAFALVGQRIYVGGLDKAAVAKAGIDGALAVQALGAAASRSALVCELSGCIDLPKDCDMLTGTCIMAGPVNQNDIGKQFYRYADILAGQYPDCDPTSMLVWTLKAKTVADPIGNEEQLLNPKRKGALVDLRAGPHEVAAVAVGGRLRPMRCRHGRINAERAFSDVDNFVTASDGAPIPGNRGSAWPLAWSSAPVWEDGP
jgi:hypothetical protein